MSTDILDIKIYINDRPRPIAPDSWYLGPDKVRQHDIKIDCEVEHEGQLIWRLTNPNTEASVTAWWDSNEREWVYADSYTDAVAQVILWRRRWQCPKLVVTYKREPVYLDTKGEYVTRYNGDWKYHNSLDDALKAIDVAVYQEQQVHLEHLGPNEVKGWVYMSSLSYKEEILAASKLVTDLAKSFARFINII